MRCEEWQQQISLWHDGILEPTQIPAMQMHLQQCPICQEFASFLQRLAEPIPTSQSSPDFWQLIKPQLRVRRSSYWIRDKMLRAALLLIALGVIGYFYGKIESLQADMAQLRQKNQYLHQQVTQLVQEASADTALIKRAFGYYDGRKWAEARHCFRQIAVLAKHEKSRALALYYLTVMASQENALEDAVQLATRLVDNQAGSAYLASLRLMLEKWAEIGMVTNSPQLQRNIEMLLEKINTVSYLPDHVGFSY